MLYKLNTYISKLRNSPTWGSMIFIGEIIGVMLSFYFSYSSYYLSIIQTSRIDSVAFASNSIAYRALIKNVGSPTVKMVGFNKKSDTVYFDPVYNRPVYQIELEFSINVKYQITNTGNSRAFLTAVIYTDTLSDFDFIRDIINKNDSTRFSPAGLMKSIELSPSETTFVEGTFPVGNPVGDKFMIHFFLLYKNETGNYFNSYFWTECYQPPFTKPIRRNQQTGQPLIVYDTSDLKIIPKSTRYSSFIYSMSDSKSVNDFLNSISKNHSP